MKLPEKCKSIGVKWIYKIKRDNSGEITRYKARLVAKGFSQVRGVFSCGKSRVHSDNCCNDISI